MKLDAQASQVLWVRIYSSLKRDLELTGNRLDDHIHIDPLSCDASTNYYNNKKIADFLREWADAIPVKKEEDDG